jgi:hypothetical protein
MIRLAHGIEIVKDVCKAKKTRMKTHLPYITRLIDTHVGEDIYVVGSGSSLLNFHWKVLADKTCIALNDAVFAPGFVPFTHIFSDVNIWNRYRDFFYGPFTQVICCQENAYKNLMEYGPFFKYTPNLYIFELLGQPEQVEKRDNGLYVNRTVATAGIMLAWKMGAKRVYLLGVDAYKVIDEKTGQDVYYFNGTTKVEKRKFTKQGELVKQDRHDFHIKNHRALRDYFKKNRIYQGKYPGDGVFNLSPLSTIDAWEKVDPGVVLGEKCFPDGMRLPKIS